MKSREVGAIYVVRTVKKMNHSRFKKLAARLGGARTQVGALLLAASLVADLLLISARIFWIIAEPEGAAGPNPEDMVTIVSLGAGALLANIISAVILVGDTLMSRR